MHELTAASQDALVEYGIRTIIDLRMSLELQAEPNAFAGSTRLRYCHMNMMGDEPLEASSVAVRGGERADRTLASYSSILDQCHARIGEILAVLAAEESRPAAYHCAGGKDRTGIISALLLGLAGVSEETISADYGLSARYMVDEYLSHDRSGVDSPEIHTWQDYQREYCPPEGMQKVLAYLNQEYGGVEGYVRAVGLGDGEIHSLRASLVE
jgi:protein-tyrosine phosphatase